MPTPNMQRASVIEGEVLHVCLEGFVVDWVQV